MVFKENLSNMANLKTGVSRKQSKSSFPKNTYEMMCVSGGVRNVCFLENLISRFNYLAILPDKIKERKFGSLV